MKGYNVVVLSPLNAQLDNRIQGDSVVILNNITSTDGCNEIDADGKLVALGSKITGHGNNILSGKHGNYIHGIEVKRLEYIREQILGGIKNEDCTAIVDALAEIYDAALHPLLSLEKQMSIKDSDESVNALTKTERTDLSLIEEEECEIDIRETFKFFNIRSKV